jgi:AraC-like DNA-binding protein
MTYYQQHLLRLRGQVYPHPALAAHLQQARHFMDQHFAEPLGLPEIAQAACCSPFHFLRQFKRYYGRTPHQYLTTVRLAHAARALTAGAAPSDVCVAVGFQSLSSFSALFRKATGRCPSAFRARAVVAAEEQF